MKFAKDLMEEDKVKLGQLLKNNTCFRLTFDEWTSGRKRRYLNLVLHYNDSETMNLGLHRVTGNATRENLLDIVKSALSSFDLDFSKHIVCIMTDGCPTMTKLGRLTGPVFQQLCYAHVLQLAVLDFLYTNEKCSETVANDDGDNNDGSEEDEDLYDDLTVRKSDQFTFEYRKDINLLVKAVRTVVKHFQSPLSNEKLQEYVQKFHGNELQLKLDCKTRWSSLFAMLERFSLLYLCVKKTG